MSDRITGPFERPETVAERLSGWLPVTRRDLRAVWDYLLAQTNAATTALTNLEDQMAADRDLLASIAQGLTALSAPITDLITSNAALRARVVELEGEAAADEAGDLEAAQGVKAAFDELAGKFTAEPEVPDVDPLPEPAPEPEAPAEPVSDGEPV